MNRYRRFWRPGAYRWRHSYISMRVVGLEPTILDFGRRDSIHLNYTPELWWLLSESNRLIWIFSPAHCPPVLNSLGAGRGSRTPDSNLEESHDTASLFPQVNLDRLGVEPSKSCLQSRIASPTVATHIWWR